jgi:2-iminobutanoate/2-iminopropanoate deaminase
MEANDMKRTGLIVTPLVLLVMLAGTFSAAEDIITKFARPGPRPTLYYSGAMVGNTYYVAGTGDGAPKAEDESYYDKTHRCFAGILRSLTLAGLGTENIVQAWVMLEDGDGVRDMTRAWKETFPENSPARTTFYVANIPGPSEMEITAIACTDLSERKIIGPEDLTYSLGVFAGETLYVSGRGSAKPGGGQHETFEEQARQAMKNMESAFNEAGLGFGHVVWSNIYLDDQDNLDVFNEVYSEFIVGGSEPARVTVICEGIPGGNHVEVTCIATTNMAGREIVSSADMRHVSGGAAMSASPGVWSGNTLYLSGLSGLMPHGGGNADDLTAQFQRMMQNHLNVIAEAGLGFEDIVSGNIYLRNIDDYGPMNELYPGYFEANGPGVRTCFQPRQDSDQIDVSVMSSFIMAGERK